VSLLLPEKIPRGLRGRGGKGGKREEEGGRGRKRERARDGK